MQRKRIYVAYTGGTIGMQRTDKGYAPVAGFLTQSVKANPEFHRDEMPEFEIHEYDQLIDSSNTDPSDWQRIADDVADNYDRFDGFVILHGTDTMAFTASALSFMLQGLSKPVIVTGSQIPLVELRSDGQTNLLNSLYIAANYQIAEVCLFFNNVLLRGNRSTKVHADGFAAFGSPNLPPLLNAGIEIRTGEPALEAAAGVKLSVANISTQAIGVVTLYPGISTEVIANILQQPVKALILLSFGVGNAPERPDLLQLLQEAHQREILVLNLTQCLQGKVNMAGYATGNALSQAGVLSGFDMTTEAALTKLHYLLSQPLSFAERCQLVQQPLRGELSQ
ncbi:asparaginase [uncultured Ferrimonas sp.]|uniref:asparaginase n=1 Tax=uncultured Ferrimonas sp. TaxID=432640 RepID=UPI002631A3F2|nr:asparaginase [uncultured Ferrimonas sp.]